MAILAQERIFAVKKTVWKYNPAELETAGELREFFESFGVAVQPMAPNWLNEHADDWITFRVGDSTSAIVAPGDYIIFSGYGEAEMMPAKVYEALNTNPA